MKILNQILIFFLLITIIFCDNPFATREPEPPSKERSGWIPPTSPYFVIENLKTAIIEGNLPNYMKCLSDTNKRFTFIPDEIESINNPSFFQRWDLSNEQNYISKLFTATTDSIRNAEINLIREPDPQDSVFIKVKYELELHHNLTGALPQFIEGQAEFWLNSSNGEYYITTWTDFQTENNPSWSSIKVTFGK